MPLKDKIWWLGPCGIHTTIMVNRAYVHSQESELTIGGHKHHVAGGKEMMT